MAVPDYLSKLTHSHPNLHLKPIAPAVRQKNTSDLPAPKHNPAGLAPPIRNAIFPPAGLKLSLGVANITVLGYLWVVCGDVWHYSSFKYRILDCPTDSVFLVPHSKTARNLSKGRGLVILFLPDKTRLKSHKVRNIETVMNLQMTRGFFLVLNFELLSVLSAVTQFTNCETNVQMHSA